MVADVVPGRMPLWVTQLDVGVQVRFMDMTAAERELVEYFANAAEAGPAFKRSDIKEAERQIEDAMGALEEAESLIRRASRALRA